MKLIHTADGNYYRRWVNLIFTFFLPGSAQFLAGRKRAGILWFLSYQAVTLVWFAYLIHPKTLLSVVSMGPLEWVPATLWWVIVADGFRFPVSRLPLKRWALYFGLWSCLTILPAFGIRTFLVQPFKVPGKAMQPTIMGNRQDAEGNTILGDHLFVNKWIYRWEKPQRGDVIAFRTKGLKTVEEDTVFVKRLVGLPGETIRIDPPHVNVNGIRITEPPIFREISEKQNGFKGYYLAYPDSSVDAYLASPTNAITLGANEYLVMGDNSQNSKDGRYFGPIKRDVILGKAFYIYAPAERKGRIR